MKFINIVRDIVIILLIMLFFSSCKTALMKMSSNIQLSNPNGSKETKYLYNRIRAISSFGYAFGHQDSAAYGVGWKNDGSMYQSDIQMTVGDFPAVYGFELGHLENGNHSNLDSVRFDLISKLIKRAHQDGGIVTISWHPDNPVTKQSAWDPSPAVSFVLKDGILHPYYRGWLTKLAEFIKNQKSRSGEPIPLVFRPFHEMNGSWFWWGQGNCTAQEYKDLWIQTYNILVYEHEVNNLLFCYSTDVVEDEKEYLTFYPGDQYVDLLGVDVYQKEDTGAYVQKLNHNLEILREVAMDKQKPFALTEAGYETVPQPDWWTEVLHKNLKGKGVSWVLLWRNAWPNHYYVPYPGQASAGNFSEFCGFQDVLLLNQTKNIK